jgi:hypothetical protein
MFNLFIKVEASGLGGTCYRKGQVINVAKNTVSGDVVQCLLGLLFHHSVTLQKIYRYIEDIHHSHCHENLKYNVTKQVLCCWYVLTYI